MKTSLFSLIAFLFVSQAGANALCEKTAEQRVLSHHSEYFVINGEEVRQIEYTDCEEKTSARGKIYNDCTVEGSAGDGGGDITFSVKVSQDCKYAFASFLTGIE